ncbi:MAG TPA: DUF962 domain-containing protein [Pyrinomonadaceae bacterium]|nr:DUF962 domain-containing protein [Pyrinomonadaceae bacterium]
MNDCSRRTESEPTERETNVPPRDYKTFADFWPHYLAEHSRPATRTLHAAGTTISTALIIILLLQHKWTWLPLALVIGYGAAWTGHFFVEHNRPATFQHPLWSFRADYKMLALMLTGRLDAELARHNGAS